MKRGEWKEASKASPCPICGKSNWCSVHQEGAFVNCRRESHGALKAKQDQSGVEYYVHKIGDSRDRGARSFIHRPPQRPCVTAQDRADTDTLNKVYSALLRLMPLAPQHGENLLARGLSDEEIQKRGYGTLHPMRRREVADQLVNLFGQDTCSAVPGVYFRERWGRKVWGIFGCSETAILIPVRDRHGRIVGIKARRESGGEGSKYVYLSSLPKFLGGPSPGALVHVPLSKSETAALIRLTEGELKADVATVKSGILTVSIPGVQAWRRAIPVLQELGAQTIRLSFDMDARENQAVAKMLSAAAIGIKQHNFNLEVETWK